MRTVTVTASETMTMKELGDIERLNTPAVHRAIHKALSRGFNVEEIAREFAKQGNCTERAAQIVVRDATIASPWLNG
jgi:hypothetical protein